MSRRTVVLLVALAALVAAGVAVGIRLGRTPPTDEEAIRALFEEAARAAGERRVSDAIAGVSERFSAGGLDRRGVKQLVAAHALRGEWASVSIAGLRLRIGGDRARASVDALLARGGVQGKPLSALSLGEASVHRFACRLEREAAGWRIVEASWRPVELGEALAGPPEPPAP